jgi:hypothetical protein
LIASGDRSGTHSDLKDRGAKGSMPVSTIAETRTALALKRTKRQQVEDDTSHLVPATGEAKRGRTMQNRVDFSMAASAGFLSHSCHLRVVSSPLAHAPEGRFRAIRGTRTAPADEPTRSRGLAQVELG